MFVDRGVCELYWQHNRLQTRNVLNISEAASWITALRFPALWRNHKHCQSIVLIVNKVIWQMSPIKRQMEMTLWDDSNLPSSLRRCPSLWTKEGNTVYSQQQNLPSSASPWWYLVQLQIDQQLFGNEFVSCCIEGTWWESLWRIAVRRYEVYGMTVLSPVYFLSILVTSKIILRVRQGLSFNAADGTSLHRPLKILSSNMVKQENKFFVANQEKARHLQILFIGWKSTPRWKSGIGHETRVLLIYVPVFVIGSLRLEVSYWQCFGLVITIPPTVIQLEPQQNLYQHAKALLTD